MSFDLDELDSSYEPVISVLLFLKVRRHMQTALYRILPVLALYLHSTSLALV